MVNLDQFYTKDEIVEKYLGILQTYINYNDYDYILEPSAGIGSFYKKLPIEKRIGIDLEPKYEGIEKKIILIIIQ